MINFDFGGMRNDLTAFLISALISLLFAFIILVFGESIGQLSIAFPIAGLIVFIGTFGIPGMLIWKNIKF